MLSAYRISDKLRTIARQHVATDEEAFRLGEQALRVISANPSLVDNDNVDQSLSEVIQRLLKQRGNPSP